MQESLKIENLKQKFVVGVQVDECFASKTLEISIRRQYGLTLNETHETVDCKTVERNHLTKDGEFSSSIVPKRNNI